MICLCISLYLFFFKQKTAYELRISDWSSDVCSSDLQQEKAGELGQQLETTTLELKRAGDDKSAAQEARDRALKLLHADPEYLKQAGESDRLKDKETRHADTRKELGSLLRLSLESAITAGKLPAMGDHQGAFESTLNQLLELQRQAEAMRVPDPIAIQSAMQAMAHVRGLVNKALSNAERSEEHTSELQSLLRISYAV